MGIALGLGVIFGIRAVEGSAISAVPVILLLIATAVVASPSLRRLLLIAALGCLLGTMAGLRVSGHEPSLLTTMPDGPIYGVIQSDPEVWRSGVTTQFSWSADDGDERVSTLYMPIAPIAGRGDRVQVLGQVAGPRGEQIFADGVRILDRANRLEMRRRAIRRYLRDVIRQHVPGTPGALTLGLLIGDDTALTESERDSLQRAGLSHITAVSGWNVMLVTSAVGLLFLKLGLRGWGWTALQMVALAGFVWVVGLDPPVTRATIMAVAGLIAIRLGRPAHSVTVLTLSAATMVAVSPAALTSLSFQLSVLATLGLVLAARLTSRYEGWTAVVVTPLVATATIGLMTAPLLAAEFGKLSLLTIPANVLAAPLVPAATIAGVVVVAAGPIAPMASLAGLGAWLLNALLLWLARVLGAVPYGYHEFAPLPDTIRAAIYAATLIVVAIILPEGRLMARAAASWVQREPFGAALTAGAACFALTASALTV